MDVAASQGHALLLVVELVVAGDLQALLLQVCSEEKITVMHYYSKNMKRRRYFVSLSVTVTVRVRADIIILL